MKLIFPLIIMAACTVGPVAPVTSRADTTAKAPGTTAPPVRDNQISPTLRLGKVPVINLGPQPPVTPQEAAHIKRLIADLTNIDSPDFGLSPTLSGTAFAPIPGSGHADALLLANHQLRPSEALRHLIEMGPRALPFLLDALDDKTPTRLTIKHEFTIGGMGFVHEIRGNPANPVEQKTLNIVPKLAGAAVGTGEGPSASDLLRALRSGVPNASYTVTIGDVCFVAIGQIVGRGYQAVLYQPEAIILINSPSRDALLAQQVRTIWASKNPEQHLLDSLLLDYSTEGVFNGRSLDGWNVGRDLQTSAAMRLLYYFHRLATPMISARLRRLKVAGYGSGDESMHTEAGMDAAMRQNVANGVRADEFIKAVDWYKAPAIRAALLGIFKRTTDSTVLLADLPAIVREHRRLAHSRVLAFLKRLPATEEASYGDGYHLLTALAEWWAGNEVEAAFKQYLRIASVQRGETMCLLLRQTRPDWSVKLLALLLGDKRPLGGSANYRVYPPNEFGPHLPIRVCDLAAQTISLNDPVLPFKMAGTHEDLDRQIAAMREQISKGER